MLSVSSGRAIAAGLVFIAVYAPQSGAQFGNGEIAEIEALLQRVPYGMLSGWSTWEAGMSDRAQDATL